MLKNVLMRSSEDRKPLSECPATFGNPGPYHVGDKVRLVVSRNSRKWVKELAAKKAVGKILTFCGPPCEDCEAGCARVVLWVPGVGQPIVRVCEVAQ